jgi:hypothetical protein
MYEGTRSVDRRTLGIAAVVLVVAGMVGGLLFGAFAAGGLPGAGGSASPTPASSTVYASQAFRPTTTVTVPPNWAVTVDQPDALQISPLITDGTASPTPSDVAGIFLFRDARAAMQDPACTTKPDPSVGTDAKSIAGWVAARPGLTATAPQPVTIGGLSGYQLDAEIAASWTTSCPFASGAPSVSLLANQTGSIRWVVYGAEKLRIAFLDVPGGGTVTLNEDVTDRTIFDGFINETTPIVASMKFAAQ